jgi:seryl-tRNA synthetase
MHDIASIRDNGDAFDQGLARRGLEPKSGILLALDRQWRKIQTDLQTLQQQRNTASKAIGLAKREGREEHADLAMAEVATIKDRIQALEEEGRQLAEQLNAAMAEVPNIPDPSVPTGADESDNQEVRRWGEPVVIDGAKEHFDLGEALGWMDFETAALIAGSRFTILSGPLARLERALAAFMLDIQTTEHGYTEISPPLMVRAEALFGTGQLPKFGGDLYQSTSGDHWLIPTAEVPLTNLVREQIVETERLPLRYTALTPCFRAEAGAAGRDTRGMIRQHQFLKVELVSIVAPEDSDAELERKTACAEEILKRLGLAYRVVLLCTGDIGFGACKTYDIEVWLAGQGRYREISSCSNTGDFQARRMNARARANGQKATRFVHTLNGSGLAVGRTMIAVLEAGQQPDGTIRIPDALVPYMGGQALVTPSPATL